MILYGIIYIELREEEAKMNINNLIASALIFIITELIVFGLIIKPIWILSVLIIISVVSLIYMMFN